MSVERESASPEALREEQRLLERLRAGDEGAFAELVALYQSPMLRIASLYVSSRAVAEEVVQEAWVGVLRGLDRFEGRSSLKTWIFTILANTAKTRAKREGRTLPFSSLAPAGEEPAVEPDRFLEAGHRLADHWAAPPRRWETEPERRLLAGEARAEIAAAIEALPPGQRTVISLRDVEGWPSEEVCSVLGLSETNQRVLLHRARAKVRAALERYLDQESGA